MARIRPYRDTDLRAVYDVCVWTADAGGDAREPGAARAAGQPG